VARGGSRIRRPRQRLASGDECCNGEGHAKRRHLHDGRHCGLRRSTRTSRSQARSGTSGAWTTLVTSPQDSKFRFDDLSTSYEQPDDKTYVFKMRPDVKVSPNELGVPERALDANDVVESYKRIISLPQSNAFAFIGKEMDTQTASADGASYTMTTKRPYAFFRPRIGSSINTIVPKEALTDANIGQLKQKAAGAGAFMLKSYTEGQGASFLKNPNYYRKDPNNNNAQPALHRPARCEDHHRPGSPARGVPVRTGRFLRCAEHR
jgi:ABC-type transport system substrate-binding protein